MSRAERKLAEGAQEFLRPGERIAVIQPVQNKGALDAAVVGGAIGAIAGAKGSRAEREAAAGIGVELGAFTAMAITDQRLLFFAISGMAKVKELRSEIPLGEVDSIEVKKAMLGTRKRIQIAARGGSFLLETPGRAKAELFTEALAAARALDPMTTQRD